MVGVGEPERTGQPRRRRRQVAARGERRADRIQPLVGREPAPGEQAHTRVRSQRTGDVGERSDGIREEHGTEDADRGVERAGRERMDLGVGLLEADVRQAFGPCLGLRPLEHAAREVDAQDRRRTS